MTQIEELKNGLERFSRIRTIITPKDLEIGHTIRLRDKTFDFIEKVEKRISNHKRIDLFCYGNNSKDIFEPNKAQENWVIVGINENGLCKRHFKRSHMWHLEMVGRYSYRNDTDISKKVIEVLTNPVYEWVYKNIKDETITEVLKKYIAFLSKHFDLLNNADTNTLKFSTFKDTELPIEFLNIIEHRNVYNTQKCVITRIKYNTERNNSIELETNMKTDGDNVPPDNIDLDSYKQFYLIEQHYDKFVELINIIKQEINEKSHQLSILYSQLYEDIDKLKADVGHIFVLDAL